MLHGCCSGVSQSHELGSQERLEWLKFECWTKVTHWSPCSALAMYLSMLQYHRHKAALSVWLLQLILCRFCQAWLRPQCSLTRKARDSGELWFKFCEKQEGWADMLVPDWIAQRRCAWTCLKISIFLTIAAAHQITFKYLKALHSASWDEVFPQSRDLNSISAALKNLNTWTETQIILVLWTEKEICFHQVFSMFFFPPKLHFYATSASGNCSPFITSWFPLSLQARSASSW